MPAFFPLDMLHDSLETDSTSVLATADLIAQGKQVLTQTLFLQVVFIFYSTVYQASCSNCIHGNVLQKMLCLTHAFTDTSNLRRQRSDGYYALVTVLRHAYFANKVSLGAIYKFNFLSLQFTNLNAHTCKFSFIPYHFFHLCPIFSQAHSEYVTAIDRL